MSTVTTAASSRSFRRNPSHASNYLTTRNGPPQSLHPKIKGRYDRTGPGAPASATSSAPAVAKMKDIDVDAPPIDSDDEDSDQENTEPAIETIESPVRVKSPPPKRKAAATKSPRLLKRSKNKLTDVPDISDAVIVEPALKEQQNSSQPAQQDLFGGMSASQKRRNRYEKKKDVPQLEFERKKKQSKPPGQMPDAAANAERVFTSGLNVHAIPDKNTQEPERPKRVLKTYAVPDFTSSATLASSGASPSISQSGKTGDVDQLGGHPHSTPATTPQSILIDNSDDDEENVETDVNLCPWCGKEVVRSLLEDPTVKLNELRWAPIRDQKRFCHEHSIADTKALYEAKQYPRMRWPTLRKRISKHTETLKQIVHRKTESYFLEQIDERVSAMPNRKDMIRFLEQQGKDIESYPPGYYGPKGTQIMAEVIAKEMSSWFSGKKLDVTIKNLGVGPFITFVLVPECTMLLVMEDMHVSEAEARTIMGESLQAGLLLHPENDKVRLDDAD